MNDSSKNVAGKRDDPRGAQDSDPATGLSDDPRVDPTPDNRHGETEHVEQPTAPDS